MSTRHEDTFLIVLDDKGLPRMDLLSDDEVSWYADYYQERDRKFHNALAKERRRRQRERGNIQTDSGG